ncbi:MaoC family dehydratase [Blastochloris tepida]|uniref:Enoyl-CoA hydratase n=1 Tax=Blastochloris tepida TaxID=2233851 RepID=A0A348FWL0_9HYPH|nr:MaoC family dehydratase [Blastochloris tepida]BBF91693.1 enoyl-CoA hydratase [Blastochloris tepida]
MPRLFFEDFTPDWTISFGPRLVSREEIVAFAAEFDPQPFHLDEEAGKASLLGGLAASGWHMCAILMRMMCDAFLNDAASHGAPGIEEVAWLKPLRPGARITMRGAVIDARASKSRPGVGLVRFRFELVDADGATLMRQIHTKMIGRRGAEAA